MDSDANRVTGGTVASGTPRGLLRLGLRLPVWLYRLRLGRLLGRRFVMVTHTGRKSGRQHQTVLEVVRYDPATGVVVVASGWGEKADWFRNILKTPAVVVNISHRRFEAVAARLSVEEAAGELCDYAAHHPDTFRQLTRMMIGTQPAGDPVDCVAMAAIVPLVSLTPAP